MRLPDNASMFTAEAKAIDLALSYIEQHIHDKFVIFYDSLSVLISIKNKKIWQYQDKETSITIS
jgi:hypothetical protein